MIDLRCGVAVHGIAGDRNNYREVKVCDGSPVELAKHYRRLGLKRLYIADLDAILGGTIQRACLQEVIAAFSGDEVIVDVGWTDDRDAKTNDIIRSIAQRHLKMRFIAATETATSLDSLCRLAEIVTPDRTLLGLDYRGGEAVNQQSSPIEWLNEAERCKIFGVVVLDVAMVGTSAGVSTQAICNTIVKKNPRLTIYSGGGVACKEDVDSLIESGCRGCLVATALHPLQT